jgi:phosphoglycolate phosphatase
MKYRCVLFDLDGGVLVDTTADTAFSINYPPVHSRRPYPGILELLRELSRRKIRRALLSDKPGPAAGRLATRLFPEGSFDMVRGADVGVPLKPDPGAAWDMLVELGCAPHEAIFMGDSELDIESARNIGCFPLGVSWGCRSTQVLKEAGAALIIDEPQELLGLLKH